MLRADHLDVANLWGSHLKNARLIGAHLNQADLSSAYLANADLSNAHLDGAKLYAAHLEQAINLTPEQVLSAFDHGAGASVPPDWADRFETSGSTSTTNSPG
jgi:uncharacterized protein YjbI with pentapeptide repeats